MNTDWIWIEQGTFINLKLNLAIRQVKPKLWRCGALKAKRAIDLIYFLDSGGI